MNKSAPHFESIKYSLSSFGKVCQHFGSLEEVATGHVKLPKKLALLPASRFTSKVLLDERRVNLSRRFRLVGIRILGNQPLKADQSGRWK